MLKKIHNNNNVEKIYITKKKPNYFFNCDSNTEMSKYILYLPTCMNISTHRSYIHIIYPIYPYINICLKSQFLCKTDFKFDKFQYF